MAQIPQWRQPLTNAELKAYEYACPLLEDFSKSGFNPYDAFGMYGAINDCRIYATISELRDLAQTGMDLAVEGGSGKPQYDFQARLESFVKKATGVLKR